MFSSEEEIAAFAVEVWRYAGFVGVAEEAVQDRRFVEAGYDEAADVGEEGDEGWLLVMLGLELGLVRAVEAVCALVGVGREGELGAGVGG